AERRGRRADRAPSAGAEDPRPAHLSASAQPGRRAGRAGQGDRGRRLVARIAAVTLVDPLSLPARRITVIAPHPDDESLGCGGLIAALAADGRAVQVVFVTDGAGSHPNSAA